MTHTLNYDPPAYFTLIPDTVHTLGMIGEVKPQHYNRYLKAASLNALNLAATDLSIPGNWTGPLSQTVVVEFFMGSSNTYSTGIDATPLGDFNTVIYPIPLLIPAETSFYVLWQNLLKTSTTKVSCTLWLTS